MKIIKSYYTTVLLIITLCIVIGCDKANKRTFISIGTAPIGGAFHPVGSAIADVVSRNIQGKNWEVTTQGTKGTQENIRLLVSEDSPIEFGMANAAISYFAVRGEGAWEKVYPIRAVMTLAPNVGIFVTPKSTNIRSISDFNGKRVVVGPAGAGFEYFLEPILKEHGITYNDFTPINDIYSQAVNLLKDGAAAAAFMGGAIPTPAITQAAANQDILFIPFDQAAKQSLIEKYPFFSPITVPVSAYDTVLTEPFETLNVGSMHLITAEKVSEELVYEFTKTLYTHRAEVAKAHAAGKAINPKNVVRDTGTPFHPGAIRFYKEIDIWTE